MAKSDFPRIEQVKSNMCGPACVEMMLRYYGIKAVPYKSGEKKEPSLQEQIASYSLAFVDHTKYYTSLADDPDPNKDPWNNFASRPVELVNMFQSIAQRIGNTSNSKPLTDLWINYFSINAISADKLTREDKIWQYLAHLQSKIEAPDHPPLIIPIHEESHWVVLYDVTVSKNKEKGKGHWVFKGKDPVQYSTKKSKKKNPNAGLITISDNYYNFDNPVNLVCIEIVEQKNSIDIFSRKNLSTVRPPKLDRNPGVPVAPDLVLKSVRKELSAINQRNSGSLDQRLSSFKMAPLNLTPPVLVRRLDRPNYDYYLLGEKDENGEIVQLIRADALTGEFLDSLQIDPTELIFDINEGNSETQSRRRANTLRPTDLPNIGQSQLEAQATVPTNLVWKPSEQSMSAFFPLHQIKPEMFRRIDGVTFNGPLTAPIKTGKQVSQM